MPCPAAAPSCLSRLPADSEDRARAAEYTSRDGRLSSQGDEGVSRGYGLVLVMIQEKLVQGFVSDWRVLPLLSNHARL